MMGGPSGDRDRTPVLVVLDDGHEASRRDRGRLVAAAERAELRVCPVSHQQGSDVERYAALLQTGSYAAVYLALGLGRYASD